LIARDQLVCSVNEGGINLLHLQTRAKAYLIKHVINLIELTDSTSCVNIAVPQWVYFAGYWIGLQLRRFNSRLSSNLIPHAGQLTGFYSKCFTLFTCFMCTNFVSFVNCNLMRIYNGLMTTVKQPNQCILAVSPLCWSNLQTDLVSPAARDLSWRLAHDILPNASKLFRIAIIPSPACSFCCQDETVDHLIVKCLCETKLWSRFNQFCLLCFKETVLITTVNVLQNLVPLTTNSLLQQELFMAFLSELKLFI